MSTAPGATPPTKETSFPPWAAELIRLYESEAASQFVLHGNVDDRFPLPLAGGTRLDNLLGFLKDVLLPRFDVVLSYDVGNGIRIEKGGEIFSEWPRLRDDPQLPKAPRPAVECLTHYFRYCANWARNGGPTRKIACILRSAQLLAPSPSVAFSSDTSALALLVRDWAAEALFTEHPLATFILTDSLSDLHPLLARNARAARVEIPLPIAAELERALRTLAPAFPAALGPQASSLETAAAQLAGATLGSVESLLKTLEHRKAPLGGGDLTLLKKRMVETDAGGLVEFVESTRTLDDIHGMEPIKRWLRQDLELWRRNEVEAMPKGYLLCGPVGTGKTFLVECLAGEAGVPVVKLKNFRDMWVGSTESNLEKIFRLIHALGRCFVFVDEADQALGRRDAGPGDSGVAGRVYAMLAEEMGSSRNRGTVVWVLATSRPDLVEIDLKRPGRVDVKIPIFPTTTPEEGFELIRALCARRGLVLDAALLADLRAQVPNLLTPGAAEALAVKVYRMVKTTTSSAGEALRACLVDYRHPVPLDALKFQIRLAMDEATDAEFIPPALRDKR